MRAKHIDPKDALIVLLTISAGFPMYICGPHLCSEYSTAICLVIYVHT
jgi:hypothetical protein